jgi:hypothetical protein
LVDSFGRLGESMGVRSVAIGAAAIGMSPEAAAGADSSRYIENMNELSTREARYGI